MKRNRLLPAVYAVVLLVAALAQVLQWAHVQPSDLGPALSWVATRVPLYLAVLLTLPFAVVAYLIGRHRPIIGRHQSDEIDGQEPFLQDHEPEYTIRFNYADSPINHGWKVCKGKTTTPAWTPLQEEEVGDALSIHATDPIDFGLAHDAATRATHVQFLLKGPFWIYLRISARHEGRPMRGWIAMRPVDPAEGVVQPYPASKDKAASTEWGLPLLAQRALGHWNVYEVDIRDAFAKTLARIGWRFERILAIRISGKVDIAWVALFNLADQPGADRRDQEGATAGRS